MRFHSTRPRWRDSNGRAKELQRQGRGKQRSAGWSYHYLDGCRTAGQQRLFANVQLARPFTVSSVACRATLPNSRDAGSRKSCNGFATSLDHLFPALSLLLTHAPLVLTYGITDVNDNLRQDTIDCDRYPYRAVCRGTLALPSWTREKVQRIAGKESKQRPPSVHNPLRNIGTPCRNCGF